MMSIRAPSPGAQPAPWPHSQPGEPGTAKRRRLEDLADCEACVTPGLEDSAASPGAPVPASVVILSEDCTLQVPLDGFSLVVEAMPDSVLQVTLEDHTLILVPQDLLGPADQSSQGQSGSADGLDVGALLRTPREDHVVVVVEQPGLGVCVPEIAGEEEVLEYDGPVELLPLHVGPPAGFTAGLLLRRAAALSPDSQGSLSESFSLLESCSRGLIFDQDFHLVRPFPTSPLQPLPPFPSPGPHERPVRLPGPHRKARRRLFLD
ncbi:proline-rich protein 23A [Octodon degus]|uniref:Proline-rich protein 23A n=1 Tax=Octodon degus TaxID=10160 RepID=A0A6P3EKU9_OCTDE|nr:proline-rich protein 23A [Octodon degus]